MMPYTQDELSSIWQKLKDGTEIDPTSFTAQITTDTPIEETMIIQPSGEVLTYTDIDPPSGATGTCSGIYNRIRGNKEKEWGQWRSV
jgi:hypothetical protein